MKRYGYLYEQMIDVENCRAAIIEAAKNKHSRRYVEVILCNLDYYALDLSKRLQEHRFTSPYREKTICDGLSKKERVIQVPKFYPDQCAHHCIIRMLKPLIMKGSYYWSCANIEKRGIDRASKGMERGTKRYKLKYCSKLDISKFYPSVPNKMLKEFIKTKIKDRKARELIFVIIDTQVGLPIGNFTSPWLAEWYLQRLDHFIKEVLHIARYIRYADDIVLLDNNKRRLQAATKRIIKFVSNELGLKIKGNYQVFPIYDGSRGRKVDFVGKCYAIGFTTIRKRRALALMRQSRLLNKLQSKECELNFHLCCGFLSRIGIFIHTNSYAMKVKYMYTIKIAQLKEVVRKEMRILCGEKLKATTALTY